MPHRPTRLLALTLALPLLAGCGRGSGPATAEPTQGVVASWKGGQATLPEVEARFATTRTPACRTARRARGGGSLDQLTPCYREIAERTLIERLVLAEVGDLDHALQELGERYFELRNQALLAAYGRHLTAAVGDVGEEEVAARFEAEPERYRRRGRLTLWNLFRRHEDPARPEKTVALLEELRQRHLAGETFAALAREYSQSETRLRDGRVGAVVEGTLPARLERVAFGLPEGVVSEPILVRGGGVLLLVRNVVEGSALDLDDVRPRIRREIQSERVQQIESQRVADRPPPDGAVVLAADELPAVLDDERVVLRIGSYVLRAAELRRLAGLTAGQRADRLDDDERARLAEVYRRQVDRGLLLIDLAESSDPDDARLREEAEELLRREGTAEIVDGRIRAAMETIVDDAPEKLRQFHADSPQHYQSPLRFKLRIWDLPFGDNPPLQLARMEELRAALVDGTIDLEAAVAQLGGSVRAPGWQDFSDLDHLPEKARAYLIQVGAGSFSVPYHQDDALHMIWVEGRQEPEREAYDVAAERVRSDYIDLHEEDLYRAVADGWLDGADFVFHEEALARLLTSAGSPEDTTP